jgi:hypothetical protein
MYLSQKLRFGSKTTFVLVPLSLSSLICATGIIIVTLHFDSGCNFLTPCLVGADVLESVELMEQNVLILLSTTTIEGFVPGEES